MLAAGLLLLKAASAHAQAFTEDFNDITTLPAAGWVQTNHSQPIGTISWFQGNAAVFPAQTGAPTAYIGVNFNSGAGAATISNWLLTPPATLVNGATLSFWTRTTDLPTPPDLPFPDRLEVRMSTAGNSTNVGTTATDVGDFTTLLLDINPNLDQTSYPMVWTQFTVTVTGVPARHFSGRGLFDRDRSLWSAFMISTPSGAIFFGADTGYGEHFAEIRTRLGAPKLALLPIGAFRPEWFMSRVHMSPEQAIEAHQDLGAQTSVATHYGTFRLADDAETEAPERIAAAEIADFWVLAFGEGRAVP